MTEGTNNSKPQRLTTLSAICTHHRLSLVDEIANVVYSKQGFKAFPRVFKMIPNGNSWELLGAETKG